MIDGKKTSSAKNLDKRETKLRTQQNLQKILNIFHKL